VSVCLSFFLFGTAAQRSHGLLIHEVISSSQRPLPDNTQHSRQMNIHAAGGSRTHNLSRRAAANPRLRPPGHWDRLCLCFVVRLGFVIFYFHEGKTIQALIHYPTHRIQSSAYFNKYLHRAKCHFSATLTEGFPCFSLSCKANARVKPAKTGHGPHSIKIVGFSRYTLLCRSVCCLFVNVHCTAATGCQPNCS